MYRLWTYDMHAVGLSRALSIMTLLIVVSFCQSNYFFLHDQSHIRRENFSHKSHLWLWPKLRGPPLYIFNHDTTYQWAIKYYENIPT